MKNFELAKKLIEIVAKKKEQTAITFESKVDRSSSYPKDRVLREFFHEFNLFVLFVGQ